MLRLLTVIVFAIVAACGCDLAEECPVEACEAAAQAQPSGEIETGLVGVAAYKTDACSASCCGYTYSRGTLLVFETDEALDPTMDKMQRFGDVEPTFTVRIQERYALTLEPRRYVLCDGRLEGCANLELGEGEVFTVNMRLVFGPARLQVFDDAGHRREDLEVD
jgi:hypothetical protein